MDINTNFIAGRMNKSVDERLIPPGEYKNALNVRLGSTETTDIGAVENSKGNTKLTTLEYDGNPLSANATCLGAFADAINETMYWFIHDANPNGTTVCLIVSFNTVSEVTNYHVISTSVLNFNPSFLITGVDLVEDLLFFTDNINPPRCININRDYPFPVSGVDQIKETDISLIVKPPGFHQYISSTGATIYDLAAPVVSLFTTPTEEENYLTDRFLSFAYRYRYQDKQYSACSLFSLASFVPDKFNVAPVTMINEGMQNKANGVQIQYSTGPETVKEIELLYKDSTSNVIYVIETFKKDELGWGNNDIKTFEFIANKVYGTLGSDELLRQFDNVPKLAKALTVQGNRLMLGNYTEGYDITTDNGQPIPIDFTTTLSTNPVSTGVLGQPFTLLDGLGNNVSINYTINGPLFGTPFTSSSPFNSIVFSLEGVELPIQAGITFDFPIKFYSYETVGFATSSTTTTALTDVYPLGNAVDPLSVTLSYTAVQQFDSVADMLNHQSFRDAVGCDLNVNTAIATSSTRNTLFDQFNTIMLEKVEFAQVANGFADDYIYDFFSFDSFVNKQAVFYSGAIKKQIGGTGNADCFRIAFPAVAFRPVNFPFTVSAIYNYFRYVLINSETNTANPYEPNNASYTLTPEFPLPGFLERPLFSQSLHSNRDYETGIVYLDEYGRATTPLVCTSNTIYIPAENSITTNKISVSIDNKPPHWAKRYKFVVKPSRATYETIYCRRFYPDPNDTSIVWFALEGEDRQIVKEGDQLIVKADDTGALDKVTLTSVLAVQAYAADELIDGSLAGLYMSMKPNNFTAEVKETDTVNFGKNPTAGLEQSPDYSANTASALNGPRVFYPIPQKLNLTTNQYELLPVPQGARIKINFRVWRSKWDPFIGSSDPSVDWRWSQEFVSPQNYPSFCHWWEGENIASYSGGSVNKGQLEIKLPPVQSAPPTIVGQTVNLQAMSFYSSSSSTLREPQTVGSIQKNQINYAFLENVNPQDNEKKFYLMLKARVKAGGSEIDRRPSHVDMEIEFYGQDNLIIFETMPPDSDDNLFYDSSELYDIDLDINGDLSHKGPIQDQVIDTNIPAIVQLPHFNCYTFFNGAESYKIDDSATGKSLVLGQRTTALSTEPYSEIERSASITYSGIYYKSSGVNNSNEFNLGLVNFKDLENNFGPVMKLHSRETDLLVLQEDRISYVLLGKNLISDSVGGGAIVSVPEVLGKQIARKEEYGISFNPESFVSWGRNMYFTDSKRAAVLQLSGGSAQNDVLNVVSDTGMRSYFRDKFITQLTTQKLGGYDPYMDEYVLSSNTTPVPTPPSVLSCGRSVTKKDASVFTLRVEIGALIGQFKVAYKIDGLATDKLDIDIIYNGTSTSFTNLTGTSNVNINKNSVYPTFADVIISPQQECTYTITPLCIESKAITQVTQFVLTSNPRKRNGETFHYGYSWTDGAFDSPITEDQAINIYPSQRKCLAALGILETQVNSGIASSGLIPYGGTTVKMFIDKKQTDTVGFDINSNKLYAYTQKTFINGCNTILADLTNLTPLTITFPTPDKAVGTATDIKLSGSTFSGTNSPGAPATIILDTTVNFINLQIDVGDLVESASGVTGTISSVSATQLVTSDSTGPATIVNPNEAYTITRRGLEQLVLVYDMRERSSVNGCFDLSSTQVCQCTGVCTPYITTVVPQSNALDACLQGNDPTMGGTFTAGGHSGIQATPVVGSICYRYPTCSPTNEFWPDGYYWVTDQLVSPSNQVIRVQSGICTESLIVNCS